MEIWKDVVGFERAYQVSNLGRVKSNITSAVLGKRNKAGDLRWSYDFGGEE